MGKRLALSVGAMALVIVIASTPLVGRAGVLEHLQTQFHSDPPTLTDVARMIDCIQNDILDQGTVVIKQPDIWSQARMTKFRKDFEDTMRPEVNNFLDYLSGQLARSDTAAFSSQTNLAATLLPGGTAPTIVQTPAAGTAPTSTAPTGFALLNAATAGTPGSTAPGAKINLSVEPNVHLDEKQDYLNHLNRLRRINLGDDTVDSAGYGMYLMRVPVSVQPGDKTVKGYGAIVNVTIQHDFSRKFLPNTYRNLVINDLVDLLTPIVHELIRSGKAFNYHKDIMNFLEKREAARKQGNMVGIRDAGQTEVDALTRRAALEQEAPAANTEQEKNTDAGPAQAEREKAVQPPGGEQGVQKQGVVEKPWSVEHFNLMIKQKTEEYSRTMLLGSVHPTGRTGPRSFAIAPSDVKAVFVPQNLLNLAFAAQEALDLGKTRFPLTNRVKLTEVGSYLRQELESAFDVMTGRCEDQAAPLMDFDYIEKLTNQVYCRKFDGPKRVGSDLPQEFYEFHALYEGFAHRLPGNLRFSPVGVLCWGIALDAGMLNRQLREDMKDTKDLEGYTCPPNVDDLYFYAPQPSLETETAFEAYVRAKWPMIAFSLEPAVDQQNIEDAFSRRRDLQLAVAFALASGQINFQQAMQFTRSLQYEAQTIALNQTVAAFAHGNDTFGWRITPRFQTPPEESNLRAVTNLLLRGGPGPNYGLKNSKIEPGLREMNAVVVMPSFVQAMRLDVANNWFRLHDPDDFKIHTASAVELGRRINEARLALNTADTCGLYRHQDVERLRARLHQLEAMLPLQSARVKVPYENTLGGFALFTQGAASLIPEILGYDGVDNIDTSTFTDIMVYGKHFSIYETAVIVGGISLPRVGLEQIAVGSTTPGGRNTVLNTTLTSYKDANGNLLLIDPNGTPVPIKDVGSYDILSREVLRVHIPPNAQTAIREDKTRVVEVYVSTPTGISNKIYIPVRAPAPATVAAASGGDFALVDDTLTVPLTTHIASGKVHYDLPPAPLPLSTAIHVRPLSSATPPPAISLTFQFDTSANGSVVETIANVPWDGKAYTIDSTRLTTFAADILNVMSTNSLLPASLASGTSPLLTSKSIAVATGLQGAAASKTVNQLKFNLQMKLVAGDSSPPAATTSATTTPAATTPAAGKVGAVTPAASSPASQASAENTGPSPSPATRDPMMRPAAFQPTLPAALEMTRQVPAAVPAPAAPAAVAPDLQPLHAQLKDLTDKTSAQIQALSDKTTALSTQVSTAVNRALTVPQGAPVVNVAVPVTNVPPALKKHQGLFHRKGGPKNAITAPLLDRFRNR